MIKNRMGFAIIETLIVVVVLTTTLIIVYSAYTNAIDYEKDKINHDNVSYIYRANYLKANIIDNSNILEFTEAYISDSRLSFKIGTNSDNLFNSEEHISEFDALFNNYSVNEILILKPETSLGKCTDDTIDNNTDVLCSNAFEDISYDFRDYIRTIITSGETKSADYILVFNFKEETGNNDNKFSYNYVWLDLNLVNQDALEISLQDYLIPVTIDSDGSIFKSSEDDENWYDYDNQEWANAVLVSNSTSTRTKYINALVGDPINESDILSYFVWIPRFKYSISTEPEGSKINVILESNETPVSNGNGVDNSYITHSSFAQNYIELEGYWVSKFLISSDTGLDNGSYNSTTNLRSLPNVTPLSLPLPESFSNKSDNIYGLDDIFYSELAEGNVKEAVEIFSRSKYGIGNVIEDTTVANQYGNSNNNNYTNSTTGNISGIFDFEYEVFSDTIFAVGEYSTIPDYYSDKLNNQDFNYTSYKINDTDVEKESTTPVIKEIIYESTNLHEIGVGKNPDGTYSTDNNLPFAGITSISGQVIAEDPSGLPLEFSVVNGVGHYSDLTIDASTGVFVITGKDILYNRFTERTSSSQTFTINISNGVNSITTQVTAGIIGTNDRPIINSITLDSSSDDHNLYTGTISVTDPDSYGSNTYEIIGNSIYGYITTPIDGNFAYIPDKAKIIASLPNSGYTENFTLKVTDYFGAFDEKSFTINLTPNNNYRTTNRGVLFYAR